MDLMKKVGWFLGISGVIMLLFGLWLLFSPAASIESVIIVLGLVLFIGGIFKLFEALFVVKGAKISAGLGAGGLISFLLGLLILASPGTVTLGVFLTFGMLAFLLALLALVSGVGQIFYGLSAKKKNWLQVGIGAAFILIALLVLFHPLAAGVGLVMAIGLYFFIYGLLLLVLAFNLKKLVGKK